MTASIGLRISLEEKVKIVFDPAAVVISAVFVEQWTY